jgi:hypothetical protein
MATFTTPAFAESDVTDELLDLSGVKVMLHAVPELMRQEFRTIEASDKRRATEPPGQYDAIVLESFQFDNLFPVIYKTVNDNLDPDTAPAIRAILRDPLANKIIKLEDLGFISNKKEIDSFSTALKAHGASSERLRLIKTLDESKQTTETALTVKLELRTAYNRVFHPVPPEEKEGEADKTAKLTSELREKLEEPTRQEVEFAYLHFYRTVTNGELARYVNLYQADEVSALNRLIAEGFLNAVGAAIDRMAEKLAKAAPEKKKS